MKIAALTLFLAALPMGSGAQERFDPVAAGGGGVWIRRGADVWCALDAHPLLSFVAAPRAGVAYSPGAFQLPELSSGAAVLIFPAPGGGAGVAITRFGFGLYSEHAVGLSWGGGGGPLRLGGGLRYTRLAIRGYGSAGFIGVDVGAVMIPLPWFRWGVRLADVNRPSIGESGERRAPLLSIAALFLLPDVFDCTVQAAQGAAGEISTGAGISALCSPWLVVRLGASENFSRIHAGFELLAEPAGVGYGCSIHPDLGWSHTFSLSFSLPR